METNEKKSALGIIAAIPFGVLMIGQILVIIWQCAAEDLGRPTVDSLLYLLVYVCFMVCLLLRKRNIVIPAAAAVWAFLEIEYFFWLGMNIGGFDLGGTVEMILAVVFCVILFLNVWEKGRAAWFIPGVIAAVNAVGRLVAAPGQISGVILYGDLGILPFVGWTYIFYPLLLAAGVWLAGRWFAYPNGAPQKNYGGQAHSGGEAVPYGDGYKDMLPHILLLLCTCGIYYLIWIYRATAYLNRVEDEEYRNPTSKLLLCMFVPFYIIYWTYKSAQRVDKLAWSKGLQSDLSSLCLILAIFVGIIPPMLMQDKINSIVAVDSGAEPAPVSAQTYGAAPVRNSGLGAAEELKAYKELLDQGVITQEEFDAKKKKLLNL